MAIGFEAFMFSQSRRKFTNKCFSTEREHINASHHLACHSVRVSAMAKKLSLQEVLDHITDQENSEEETTEDESYSEDALQDILEEENITEQAENLATTEEEQSSDFEGQAEVDVTFWSKDGNLSWSSSPTEKKGRLSTEKQTQTQVGQTFARHMQNVFVSHVNKFTKWPVARHIQMLVSVTCMSSNNNQVFVDVVLYMAMPMFLFFCHNGQIFCSMILSVWQCQCARYI